MCPRAWCWRCGWCSQWVGALCFRVCAVCVVVTCAHVSQGLVLALRMVLTMGE